MPLLLLAWLRMLQRRLVAAQRSAHSGAARRVLLLVVQVPKAAHVVGTQLVLQHWQ